MPLLRITILVIFGVVASQNHDVNSQTPYRKMIRPRSVEAETPIPPHSRVDDVGIDPLLARLKTFSHWKSQSTQVQSTVEITRGKLDGIDDPLTGMANLLVGKLDNLPTEVGRMSQCCSGSATPVDPINKNLEVKVENLSKDIQLLIDATRILSFNMEMVKQNVSSLINNTRSVENSLSKVATKPIFNEGLQIPKNLPTAISICRYPKNCREVRQSGNNVSGIYMLEPEHASKPFEAICDLEVRGGNWTVIQRRYDGSQDFYLGWEDYKNGFGNLTGEFWLGLENVYLLTRSKENEILIELEDFESHKVSAFYSNFTIGSECQNYTLYNVGEYSGDAGDSLTDGLGRRFSTKDMGDTSCAIQMVGAWWHNCRSYANLNGMYSVQNPQPGTYNGLYWRYFKDYINSLKHTRMLVRPKM